MSQLSYAFRTAPDALATVESLSHSRKRLRTVADGCERLRTVAHTDTTFCEHSLTPRPPNETGTLATHSGKTLSEVSIFCHKHLSCFLTCFAHERVNNVLNQCLERNDTFVSFCNSRVFAAHLFGKVQQTLRHEVKLAANRETVGYVSWIRNCR